MAETPKPKSSSAGTTSAPASTEPTELVALWREDLNRTPPSVAMAVDVTGSGYKTQVFLDAPAPDAIRIDLSGGGAITAANIAAALSIRDVARAAAELIDVAAGRSSEDVRYLSSVVTNAVFGQVDRYPLNRPDVRYPSEGGWSVT